MVLRVLVLGVLFLLFCVVSHLTGFNYISQPFWDLFCVELCLVLFLHGGRPWSSLYLCSFWGRTLAKELYWIFVLFNLFLLCCL